MVENAWLNTIAKYNLSSAHILHPEISKQGLTIQHEELLRMTINSAVILAAGRGSRLKTITEARSKAMIPIVGKPMVERVMTPLILYGIKDFIIVANPDDHHLQTHFNGGNRLSINIKFVFQDHPKGTAHALCSAAPYLHQDFILSACDNLVPTAHVAELINTWNDDQPLNGILSLMLVEKTNISRTALVELDNNYVTRIIEKPTMDLAPSHISSIPLYCFSTRIIKHLQDVPLSERGEYELQDAIQKMITHDGFVRGEFTKFRLTVTCPDDLLSVNLWYFNQYKSQIEKIPKNVCLNSNLISPVHIEDGSIIGQNCLIGPNVFIESKSIIEDFVTINDSMILQGARVFQGSTIKNQIIMS